ncbi:MAG: HEAT repeat domain-containing protein, partial [Flavobacteriales bacterium]|nr:HEAT repeat domain-containing protein [Flavobacteriales bacterium]
MKRICILSSILFIITTSINAQINRTLETKVADILMQLPTDNQISSDKISSEIIDLGEVGILKFCEKLKPLGTGDDTQARFAINSLATYQGSLENPIKENIVEKSLVKAIESSIDVEVRTFLIRRLAFCGSDFSAEFLSKNLKDDNPLFKPSLATMSYIGSDKSLNLILQSLDTVNKINKVEVVSVLSSHRYKPATKAIEKLYNTENKQFKSIYLMALAEIANASSKSFIKSTVIKSKYKLDKSKSIFAYIKYGNRLLEDKNTLSTEIAEDIIANCKEDSEIEFRFAALRMLYANSNYPIDLLIKESKVDNELYQKEIFKIASNSLSDKNISSWINEYQNANVNYKKYIIRLLGSIKD